MSDKEVQNPGAELKECGGVGELLVLPALNQVGVGRLWSWGVLGRPTLVGAFPGCPLVGRLLVADSPCGGA